MLDKICNVLKTRIESLAYSDVVGSLSRAAIEQTELTDENGEVYRVDRKVFPVSSNVSQADCTRGAYHNLAPNSDKKSVIYFERLNDEALKYKSIGILTEITTKCRLVVWLNLRAIGQTITGDATSIPYQLIDLCSNKSLPFTHETVGYKAQIVPISIIRDPSIFLKYSYDKAIINNMLLYPYEYFAIDFSVTYTINTACLTFTPSAAIC